MDNTNESVAQTEYVIVPLCALKDKDAEAARNNYPQCIISQRELTAMYQGAVREINNGDIGIRSLNVKLYNCIAHYVHTGLDEITDRKFKRLV